MRTDTLLGGGNTPETAPRADAGVSPIDKLDFHYALVRPIGRIVDVFLRIAGRERTIGPFSA